MSDAPRGPWRCPSCTRQVPRGVETCRCGSERRRLEGLGYRFDTPPPPGTPAPAPPRHREPPPEGVAAALVGYRSDRGIGIAWRIVLKGGFTATVAAVAGAMIVYTHTEPRPTRANVEVRTTLADFTRAAGPAAGNTIPAFLALPGRLGVLPDDGADETPVRVLGAAALQSGYCSQNIAGRVRHEYPGYYDRWPDDRLERTVLAKHPEYAEEICTLSVTLDADPETIVSFEPRPRPLLAVTGLWLRTLAATALAAFACSNVYYRAIVAALAPD